MVRFSPMTPARYADRPYLYNPDNPLHQRAATTREQLHHATRMTVQDAINIALSTEVHNADLWQARLVEARQKAELSERAAKAYELIVRWNRCADANSVGAVVYRYWKDEVGPGALQADRAGFLPPAEYAGTVLIEALEKGAEKLEKEWGRLEVKYGEVY